MSRFRLLPNFIVMSAEGIVPDEELPDDARAAVDLLMDLNRHGYHYRVDDGILRYSGPEHLVPSLRAHRDVIVDLLSARPDEPCRGGCGKPMQPGQMCVPCATRVAIGPSCLRYP